MSGSHLGSKFMFLSHQLSQYFGFPEEAGVIELLTTQPSDQASTNINKVETVSPYE